MTEIARRRRLPPSERRESILAAALELFGARSYSSVGMREIAEMSDLSATGIYRHFASKEALLVGLFDRLSDQIAGAMREASRLEGPRKQLAHLISFHVKMVVREPAVIPIYQRQDIDLPSEEFERFNGVLRDYLSAWTNPLLELDDTMPTDVARTTVVATFGTMNGIAFHRSGLAPRALEKLITDLAWRTLGFPPDD
ncbi:TetR/AcrR family transcriptional regulator [Rhodococcus qingshengii]|uniref:TetR/AcrR family transcriptional regulator n=1 Tax=Rhodococcus qingshengii TaxID=334542 RepID=UPI0036DE8B23